MPRIYLYLLALAVFGLSLMPSSLAQQSADHKTLAMASTAPTSGFRAEFLEGIAYYEQRYTRLAEAMPAEKYTWRRGEGVRSVGEVFTHIIGANYASPGPWGPRRPAAWISKPSALFPTTSPRVQALTD